MSQRDDWQKKRPVVFDVGANIGEWSQMALEINPKAQIYAFEPNQQPFKTLSQISQIKTYNVGCSNQAGSTKIYDRQDNKTCTHSSLDPAVLAHLKIPIVERVVH